MTAILLWSVFSQYQHLVIFFSKYFHPYRGFCLDTASTFNTITSLRDGQIIREYNPTLYFPLACIKRTIESFVFTRNFSVESEIAP